MKETYVGWQDTIVSGWGSRATGGPTVGGTLQYARVPPVSDRTCNQPESYNGRVTSGMMCAGKILLIGKY